MQEISLNASVALALAGVSPVLVPVWQPWWDAGWQEAALVPLPVGPGEKSLDLKCGKGSPWNMQQTSFSDGALSLGGSFCGAMFMHTIKTCSGMKSKRKRREWSKQRVSPILPYVLGRQRKRRETSMGSLMSTAWELLSVCLIPFVPLKVLKATAEVLQAKSPTQPKFTSAHSQQHPHSKCQPVSPISQSWDLHVPKGSAPFLEELGNPTVDVLHQVNILERSCWLNSCIFHEAHL